VIVRGAGVTVTDAEADLEVSAFAVAVIVAGVLAPTLGAVKRPEDEMAPELADHVTAVFALPVTVAVNCCVLPDCTVTEVGEIEMLTGTGGGGVNPMPLPPPLQLATEMHTIKQRGKTRETTGAFFIFEGSPCSSN
jgi:hypothetical protein